MGAAALAIQGREELSEEKIGYYAALVRALSSELDLPPTRGDLDEARRIQELLDRRERFEQLLMTLSNGFVSCASEEIDGAINEALADIGTFVEVDRSYVFLFDDLLGVMNNSHEWCSGGIRPERENLQGIPVAALPAWMRVLRRNEVLYIPNVAELDESWAAERAVLEPQGILSLVVVPVTYSGRLLGFVGFDSVRSSRAWNSDELGLLRVLGKLLANAITRRDQDRVIKLREREALEARERLSRANTDLAATNRELESEKRNLEVFQAAAVDQEMVAIELKREVNNLLRRLGEGPKYLEIDEIDQLLGVRP